MSDGAIYWEDNRYSNSYNTQFFNSYDELPSFEEPDDFVNEEYEDDFSEDYLLGTVWIDDGYLNVRSSASSNGKIIGKLYAYDEVTVYDWEGDWCKIIYNGQTGYVHSDYLMF